VVKYVLQFVPGFYPDGFPLCKHAAKVGRFWEGCRGILTKMKKSGPAIKDWAAIATSS
jgi:hypothetical protein